MNSSGKATYNLVLALAFIGIGCWKLYGHFYGSQVIETYQVVLGGLLVVFGFFQLYRWWKARQEAPKP